MPTNHAIRRAHDVQRGQTNRPSSADREQCLDEAANALAACWRRLSEKAPGT